MGKINDKILFFKSFIKNPKRNASVIPSSKFTCKALIDNIDFSSVNSVVELGPGVGVCTEQILKKCKPKTKVILVELEDSYIDILQKKYGNKILVENTCASNLDKILKKHKLPKADLIVSGLPYLSDEMKKKLFDSLKRQIGMGTIFRFLTFSPPIMKKVYEELPVKKVDFVLRNIPPMWVYGIN